MGADIVKRTVECPNEHCGNTLYERTVSYNPDASPEEMKFTPIWKCTNCCREYPRKTRHHPTNRSKAMEAWRAIKEEWEPTEQALQALVDAGKIKSGALLVHGRTWNYHMEELLMTDEPSNFDVRYHIDGARQDLEKAKAFVAEQEKL